jgi:hypothetical protein
MLTEAAQQLDGGGRFRAARPQLLLRPAGLFPIRHAFDCFVSALERELGEARRHERLARVKALLDTIERG